MKVVKGPTGRTECDRDGKAGRESDDEKNQDGLHTCMKPSQRAGKMARWGKALATKPKDLDSIPGTHTVEKN